LAVVGVFLAAVAVAGCGGITPPTSPVPMYDAAAPPLRTIEGRAPRVLVVGDSIADQMGSHALFALEEMGIDARLHAAWGRGLFTRSQYDMGEPIPDPPSATLMHEATQAVIDFDPDVVAVYSNHNYWASTAPHDAAGNVIEMGSPAWDEMVQEQLAVLMQHLTVNGAVVYFVKPVPSEAGRTAADNVIWNSYLAHRQEFGFGIINAGDILAAANGKHVQQLSDCAGDPRDVRPPDDLHLTYYGAGLSGSVLARALAQITGAPTEGSTAPAEPPTALVPTGSGYRMVTCDGATFLMGSPGNGVGGHALGSTRQPNDPVVSATKAGLGQRTLLLTEAGKVLPLGAVASLGDAVDLGPANPAVDIAPTATYDGYWIAASNGDVQEFGDAAVLGDLAGQGQTVVTMAPTGDRTGYWLLTATGRVVPFGTATLLGDLEASMPNVPLVGMVARPQAEGYWILDGAGNVYPFGAAVALGSAANQDFQRITGFEPPDHWIIEPVPAAEHPTTATAILPTATGDGYWISLANGAVCHFGDAPGIGALHRPQINFLLIFLGHEFYGDGSACSQFTNEPPPVEAAEQAVTEATGQDALTLEALPDVPSG
jgi:hypothetical protein